MVAGGRKLVGSAQVREGSAFLQHGSVLLEDGQDIVAQVTSGKRVQPQATSISGLLGRPVTFAEVAQAIELEARHAWPGEWSELESRRLDATVERFTDSAWTWRR